MRGLRAIRPDVWLLILGVSFLPSIPMGFMQVALPIYLDRIGLHPTLIGTLYTISGIASAALLVVFGFLADRYGRKPFVLVGVVLPVASYLLLAFTTSQTLILFASAVGGIGLAGGMSGALVTAGYNALLTDKTTTETRTTVFTTTEIAWVAAAFTGSLVAGLPALLEAHAGTSYRGGYHLTFLAMAVIGALGAIAVLPVPDKRSALTTRQNWLPRRSGRRIAILALSLGMLGLGLGFIVQLLPLWFHLRFHVNEAYLAPWYGLSQIAAVSSLVIAAPLSHRFGHVRFVVTGQVIASILLVVMAFSPSASVAVWLWIGRTIVMNATWPVQQAYIMGVVEADERATASSLTYAAWSVASALTPPVGGALLSAGRFTAPFLLGAGCYVLSIGLFWARFRRVRPVAETRVRESGIAIAAD